MWSIYNENCFQYSSYCNFQCSLDRCLCNTETSSTGHLEKKTPTKAEIYNQPATTDLKHGHFAHILLSSSFFNISELESKTINYTHPYVQLKDLYECV